MEDLVALLSHEVLLWLTRELDHGPVSGNYSEFRIQDEGCVPDGLVEIFCLYPFGDIYSYTEEEIERAVLLEYLLPVPFDKQFALALGQHAILIQGRLVRCSQRCKEPGERLPIPLRDKGGEVIIIDYLVGGVLECLQHGIIHHQGPAVGGNGDKEERAGLNKGSIEISLRRQLLLYLLALRFNSLQLLVRLRGLLSFHALSLHNTVSS